MASIEKVKAALAQAAEQGSSALGLIRTAIERTEQVLNGLRGVAAGSQHAKALEATHWAEQTRQGLHEGATPIKGSTTAAREYVGVLGVPSDHGEPAKRPPQVSRRSAVMANHGHEGSSPARGRTSRREG